MGLDPRHFILCTDDSHSQTLVAEGHVDRAVRQAIAHGIDPITTIQMTTLNTAEHFGVAKDIGMIAPGRFADILILKDLIQMEPDIVIAKGRIAVENRSVMIDIPTYPYPEWVMDSVHIGRSIKPVDFILRMEYVSPGEYPSTVIANVIGVIENQAPTRHLRLELNLDAGEAHADMARDIAKVAVIDRHHASGRIQLGLVSGFGFNTSCAVGSTVVHDSHHMLIVGTNDLDMAIAANELAHMNGGQIVVSQGEVLGRVALPIAGLMSNDRAENVAKQVSSVLAGFRTCGCQINNPNMQLSLLGLVVIPDLRISDLGLVDVNRFEFISALERAPI
jgi:adenine deaminase